MGFPKVEINLTNGQLGRVPVVDDSIAGMLLYDAAGDGTVHKLYGVADAEAAGLTGSHLTQIEDFYAQAGEGSELYVCLTADNTTAVFAKNGDADNIITMSGGKVRIMASDAVNDTNAAQAFAERHAGEFSPLRILIEEDTYAGDETALPDLKTQENNRVGVVIGSANGTLCAIGLALGKLASLSVQENLGKVKSGNLGIDNAYLIDGTKVTEVPFGKLEAIHNKGYILMRQYQGKDGFFFADDPSAVGNDDDYSSIAQGRVIDKAIVLAYGVYIEELNDDVQIDPDTGQIHPAEIKALQAGMQNVLEQSMIRLGNISGASVEIDPAQDILSTDKLLVKVRLTPVGYLKEIEVELGFFNPTSS